MPWYKKWWVYLLALFLLFCVAEMILLAGVIINASRLDAPQPADALIVLGAAIDDDGAPKPMLARRLDRAAALYEAGYAPLIIMTGAQGDDEPMPEAEAMKAYLVARGIPQEAILCESHSYNTRQNLQNAKDIMDTEGLHTAVVVSSDYHLWRALSICGDIGLPATGAGAQNALTVRWTVLNWLQETASWWKYLLTR